MTGTRHTAATIQAALELRDAGWTQQQVATKLGVADTTVKTWMGKRAQDPSLSWLPSEEVVVGARHGTLTGYVHDGCRCRPCRDAYSVYERRRAKERIMGLGPRLVPAVGSQRRLGGLYWMGWPGRELATRIGVPYKSLAHVHRSVKVRRALHEKVKKVYEQLHMAPGPSVMSRARAHQYGHVPPLAWDEATIDDPNAAPDLLALSPDERRWVLRR